MQRPQGRRGGNKVKGISALRRIKGDGDEKKGRDVQLSVINTLWLHCFFCCLFVFFFYVFSDKCSFFLNTKHV